ncbi:MAG TPA: glucose-6-phosphate dehydrogenase, partial [Streptosporangiaceae bacterium]|nr:glucose-6-phosphate dehydrogenase [Streptosporangiaceae bacterium]
MSQTAPQPADALVIFGITGDLARKQTLRSLYRLESDDMLNCPVIGVAKDHRTPDQLRSMAREAVEPAGEAVKDTVFDRLLGRFSYVQ